MSQIAHMAKVALFMMLPLGGAAYRAVHEHSLHGGANATAYAGGALEGGSALCMKCDEYGPAKCALCPNCKRRSKTCMHKCTSCCGYKRGCTSDYCICDGSQNAFKGMWKDCGNQQGPKTYRFQVRLPLEKPFEEDETFVAIEFRRTAEDPHLILHYHQEWTVEMTRRHAGCFSDGGALLQAHENVTGGGPPGASSLADVSKVHCQWSTKLKWKVVAATSARKPETRTISLKDTKYIRVSKEPQGKDESVTTLEIMFPDGESLKLQGGIYMIDWAFLLALDLIWPVSDKPGPDTPPPQVNSGVFVGAPEITYRPRNVGSMYDPDRLPTHKATFRFAKMFERLMKSAGDRRLHKKGVELLYGKRKGSKVAAVFLGMFGGLIGLAGGPLGVVAGAAAGASIPLGIKAGANKHGRKDVKREIRLLASEKIFEKMRCHPLFQRCGGIAIAPKAPPGACPSETKGEIILPGTSGILGDSSILPDTSRVFGMEP